MELKAFSSCAAKINNAFDNIFLIERPYNFGVFQCRKLKFGNMILFDVFSLKMSLVFKFEASMTSSI